MRENYFDSKGHIQMCKSLLKLYRLENNYQEDFLEKENANNKSLLSPQHKCFV